MEKRENALCEIAISSRKKDTAISTRKNINKVLFARYIEFQIIDKLNITLPKILHAT